MKKEFISVHTKETAIRVQNSEINALRLKDIVKKGTRVYQGGKIGISGAIGNIPLETLEANAIDNLSLGIDYPFPLSKDNREHRCYNDKPIEAEAAFRIAESLLAVLRQDYPDFSFSESISVTEVVEEMNNTVGLNLKYQDSFFSIGLLLKDKKLANLFDGFLIYLGRRFDSDKFWSFNHTLLEAYRTKAELPAGQVLPVFYFEQDIITGFLARCLNGERFATGSSLFSKKLRQQLFNEKINLEQSRDSRFALTSFFDREGVVLAGDCYPLIEAGKLVNVFTDKKTAHQYNLPHTGAAAGEYDGMPRLSSTHLRFQTDTSDLQSALQGQPAILVAISSGGDFTPDGGFAAPIQISFLFDGQRILGKLPEFTVRSHINKMLGEDYIGTFDNDLFFYSDLPTQLQGFNLEIIR